MTEEKQTYRDQLSTLDEQGHRKWIFPKKPVGTWYNRRKLVSYFLLSLLFAIPFIRIGGEPLLLINVIERRFIIFGQIFWPQDFFLFGMAMVTMVLFVILFTVAFGRLFCGWMCPQTIFMEMFFRRIEYWIEGDSKHQQRLEKMPWNAEKIRKKTLKHVLFFGLSFFIANTFLAYIIGTEQLFVIISNPPSEHAAGLFSIMLFTAVFYGVFAKFREQVCTNVCPYGRLQGVMLDRNSMLVAYDHKRGENRSWWKKGENRSQNGKGDCIDCNQCVEVCPTGIDIRNGTQLECINCTACIDACDHVMEKVGIDKGLIRYASENTIVNGTPYVFTKRLKAYTAVLSVLMVVLGLLIFTRSDVGATLLRTPGMLFQTLENGQVSNLYQYKVINKTNTAMPLEFKLINSEGELQLVGEAVILQPQGVSEGALFIKMNATDLKGTKTRVKVGVYSEGKLLKKLGTNFIGPYSGKTK